MREPSDRINDVKEPSGKPTAAKPSRRNPILEAFSDDKLAEGWYFHVLKAEPARYSVRVTANYRLTFAFEAPDAEEVDIEDYH